jgi:hypothetical protein
MPLSWRYRSGTSGAKSRLVGSSFRVCFPSMSPLRTITAEGSGPRRQELPCQCVDSTINTLKKPIGKKSLSAAGTQGDPTQYPRGARFLRHGTTRLKLRHLFRKGGTIEVLKRGGNSVAVPYGTLLGRPKVESTHLAFKQSGGPRQLFLQVVGREARMRIKKGGLGQLARQG